MSITLCRCGPVTIEKNTLPTPKALCLVGFITCIRKKKRKLDGSKDSKVYFDTDVQGESPSEVCTNSPPDKEETAPYTKRSGIDFDIEPVFSCSVVTLYTKIGFHDKTSLYFSYTQKYL